MRITDTVNNLLKELENDKYVFSYLFKKELKKSLRHSFRNYYDVGVVQFKQILKHLKNKVIMVPEASRFSFTHIYILLRGIFDKQYSQRKVITKSGIANFNQFFTIVDESINQSDLSKLNQDTK